MLSLCHRWLHSSLDTTTGEFSTHSAKQQQKAAPAVNLSGDPGSFNEAYRYVDWLLTVPLLLVEVIAVLALAKEVSKSLIMRLVPASAAMIALGYPGEISTDQDTQVIYGVLSTLPFLYILYVLFVELTKSLDRQPAGVADTVKNLRLLLIATWGVYPIAYILGMGAGDPSADAFVGSSGWIHNRRRFGEVRIRSHNPQDCTHEVTCRRNGCRSLICSNSLVIRSKGGRESAHPYFFYALNIRSDNDYTSLTNICPL